MAKEGVILAITETTADVLSYDLGSELIDPVHGNYIESELEKL